MHSKPLPDEDIAGILSGTEGLWPELRGQSIFITGGTGFFGLWLLESFARANESFGLGAKISVLTRDLEAFRRKAPHLVGRTDIKIECGDVRSFRFPRGEFRYFIHAAADVSSNLHASAPEEMLDILSRGTQRVLEFAARSGAEKFLFTSSGAIYGRQPSDLDCISEDYPGAPDPLLPSSAYGEGKRISEHLCAVHALKHGYELKIARCFAFIGPHMPLNAQFAIGNFIRDAISGSAIRILGDGTALRSYLYASDLAIWLWTLLFRGVTGRAYNVGSSVALSIADVAAIVSDALNSKMPIEIGTAPTTRNSSMRYIPSTTRAESELGLRQRVPLSESIRKTADWHRVSKP